MEPQQPDWRDLPPELLALILKKLHFLRHYLHFSAVCKSWHSVARNERDIQAVINASRVQIPMLLVPAKEEREGKRGLYNILNKKILQFKVNLPCDQRCAGSSHGFLLFSTKTDFVIYNPFTNAVKVLPPVTLDLHEYIIEEPEELFHSYYVRKAVLSCDPFLHEDDYEVVIAYAEYDLAIFRAGDPNWTAIEKHPRLEWFYDVIYHKGAFYAVDVEMGLGRINSKSEIGKNDTIVWSYNIEMIAPKLVPQIRLGYFGKCHFPYLVESSKGNLLCAVRMLKVAEENDDKSVTFNFRLFKLEMGDDLQEKWVEIDTLGGDALFLGDNHSIAVNTDEFSGCQQNSIYYTDDRGFNYAGFAYETYGPHDIGIYKVEDRRCDRWSYYIMEPSDVHKPPALWILLPLK